MTRGFSTAPVVERGPVFDWYAASLPEHVGGALALDVLRDDLGGGVVLRSRGRHGYGDRAVLMHGERPVVSVSWGGTHSRCHVESGGGSTQDVCRTVRARWPEHRVTRVDSALDWDDPEAWDQVHGLVLGIAQERGLSKALAGDWIDPHQRPGDGRTLYVGAPSSAVRMRVYEKGRQLPEAGRPDWVRAEVQCRPQRAAKGLLASAEPLAVWGTARWTQDAATRLLGGVEVPATRVVTWREPDALRARTYIVRSLGRVLSQWALEVGGWESLGRVLGDEIEGAGDAD